MLLAELVATSTAVAETSARLEKIDRLATLLRRIPPEEIDIAVAFLSGSARDRARGRIGVGGAAIIEARGVPAAVNATLELREVDAVFARVAAASGSGSGAAKVGLLRDLLARATADEQDFLVRLLFGELRQGALEGVLLEAVARASGVPAVRVRRAAMLAGALAPVARAVLAAAAGDAGDAGSPEAADAALARFMLQPFQPVQPMLADSAADVGEALATLGEASLEYKLDGARIQVHKRGEDVRVFTRNLRDVTPAVPEVVEIVRANPSRDLILDGEVLALGPNRTPHPFQVTMRRFGRKLDVDRLRQQLPLAPFFFDCLYVDGDPLVEEPLSRRVATLAALVDPQFLVPRIMTAKPEEAAAFLDRAIATGHEGVMAKAPGGTYAAGRRGQAWLKIKRARTLDLVVLAAEWGHGRRRGLLSNLHLGARDPERGGFVMLGKTFKGLTDDMLAWQTQQLLELELARDAYTVHVRPELVVEIAFNDVQESPQYPGRLALRFARVKRYRTDKAASDADTLAGVQAIYRQMTGCEPPAR